MGESFSAKEICSPERRSALSMKARLRVLLEGVKKSLQFASDTIRCCLSSGRSGLIKCNVLSSGFMPLRTATNKPRHSANVEATLRAVPSSFWSSANACSHSVLIFLLWVKQFGIEDAVHYVFDTQLRFPEDIMLALVEFCRLEGIDLEQ